MRTLAFAASLILCLQSDASTGIAGIELPTRQEGLELQGAGLLKRGIFFRIYVGALYTESTPDTNKPLAEKSKRIDIHYFHRTPKKHMIRVAEKTLEKNLSPEKLTALSPMIDQLHEAFLDGEKGAVASLIHLTGKGLEYRFDGKTIVTFPGDDFANAYFSIWLGEHPGSQTMKKAMLGGTE